MPIMLFAQLAWANPQAPIYWNYPGPFGQEIRSALALERTDEYAHHLLLPDELEAYLSDLPLPGNFGCLDDSSSCEQEAQGILNLLGFQARVDAAAVRDGEAYRVKLTILRADSGQRRVFSGRGADVAEAARAAFVALIGQGSLILDVTPPTASFRIDGRSHGEGSGTYMLPAGKHVITIEAENYKTTEEPIEVGANQSIKLTVKLAPEFGRLSLRTTPEDARVFLDGELWSTPKTLRDVSPGQQILRVEADGYESFSQNVEIRAGVEHALKLKLQGAEPPWRIAMRSRHPDTYQNNWYVRTQLQTISSRNGRLDLETNRNYKLKTQSESIAMLGIELSAGWRSKHLDLLGIGLSMQTGLNDSRIILDNDSNGLLESLDRTMLRIAWPGLRYQIWRVDAFALAGLGLAFEELSGAAENTPFRAAETRLFAGTELGLRYSVTPAWWLGSSIILDYWPDSRPSVTWTINGEYNFDLKGLL